MTDVPLPLPLGRQPDRADGFWGRKGGLASADVRAAVRFGAIRRRDPSLGGFLIFSGHSSRCIFVGSLTFLGRFDGLFAATIAVSL